MTSFKTSNKSWLFTFILVLYIYFFFFLYWPFPLFKSCNFICSRQEPKHLPAAGISADNTRGWDIVRKIKHLAEKRSFGQMWNFEPRALSSDIPASQKRVYLFYDPMINFSISNMLGEEEKQKHVVSARANDENKHIDWLIFFLLLLKLWLDQGLTGCRVKWTFATPHRSKIEKGALLVYILPTALFENYSKNLF